VTNKNDNVLIINGIGISYEYNYNMTVKQNHSPKCSDIVILRPVFYTHYYYIVGCLGNFNATCLSCKWGYC